MTPSRYSRKVWPAPPSTFTVSRKQPLRRRDSSMIEGPSVWEYLDRQWPRIEPLLWQQIELILLSMFLATAIGVTIGVVVSDRPRLAAGVQAVASGILTVPSLALLTLFIPLFGLGWTSTVVALVLYAQLPIIRNTVTGMCGVQADLLESARGIGMSTTRRLARVQLPLAWPVILAGLRVATMMMFGISAIAAYVNGPGLGNLVFTGLSRLGSVNAENQALVGGFGIAMLALLFDGGYLLLRRFTVPTGMRGTHA
jgi:osmoprotectant transport system permease protein